jgi:RNA polymerase sigma-70 factor (ECF subfamily)
MTNETSFTGMEMDMDRALVMQIKAGNKKALGQLVERHKKQAFQIALGLVGNKDDAYDISQEAFLRVYRSAKTFDERQPFLPWFYTIIANLCRSALRRRTTSKKRNVNVDDVSYMLVSDDDPEGALIKRETIARLRQGLRELPFADREIISLQHFREMSYDEIAALLGIPRGTVMSRLYYARKKLAAIMLEKEGQ